MHPACTLIWQPVNPPLPLRCAPQSAFQLPLPPTLAMDYPTPGAIAALVHAQLLLRSETSGGLAGQHASRVARRNPPPRQMRASSGSRSSDLAAAAVVAMSVRGPGSAGSAAGMPADAVGTVPYARWAVEDHAHMHEADAVR